MWRWGLASCWPVCACAHSHPDLGLHRKPQMGEVTGSGACIHVAWWGGLQLSTLVPLGDQCPVWQRTRVAGSAGMEPQPRLEVPAGCVTLECHSRSLCFSPLGL